MNVPLCVVFVTAPDAETARKLARVVVEERLVACVNVLTAMESVYRWQGQVVETAEVLLVMKTVHDRLATLITRVKELHPYKVPEVIALPVETALPAYAAWVADETSHLVI